MTTMTPAPPEHWQITLTAGILAGVVLIAVIGFTALAVALRRDQEEET